MRFKDYLIEATFGYSETKYLDSFIKRIEQGKPLRLGKDGTGGSVVIKYDDQVKALKKDKTKIKDTIFTDTNGNQYKFTKFFKGDFSGFSGNTSKINFGNGKNTKIGESIQNIGFYLTESDLSMDSEKLYKKILGINYKINSADPSGVEKKYLNSFETFKKYELSFIQILSASVEAIKQIRQNESKFSSFNTVHKNIQRYYNILKKKKLVNKNIKKENTADLILYTGKDILDNIENGKLVTREGSWVISVEVNGVEKNKIVQISLKSGGRIGDSSTLNIIANKYKKDIFDEIKENVIEYPQELEEGFLDYLKKTANKVFNYFKKIVKKAELFFKRYFKKYDDQLFNDLKNLSINEKRFDRLPKEDMIWEFYNSNQSAAKKLMEKKFNSAMSSIINKMNSFSVKTTYNIKEKTLNIPKNITKEELRLIYYNVVSILTFSDYLDTVISIEDITKLEQEIVLGNSIFPLIKVEASGDNPVEFIRVSTPKSPPETVLGLLINKKEEHYVFYIFILSSIKDPKQYLKIQMRTSGDQYKIDGNAYVSEKQFKAYMS
jgi:DNA-binding protein Fis